jgi:hypothetical protein
LKAPGSPDKWRCIAPEKLSSLELVDVMWRTALNHSRPASCIVDADVEAKIIRSAIHSRGIEEAA